MSALTPVVGDRIKMLADMDDPAPVLKGETGTITNIDDGGTLHVQWDSGRFLGAIPGEDQYEILEEDDTPSPTATEALHAINNWR